MRGFTLLELMVVMMIMTMIMVIVPMSLSGGMGTPLQAATRDLTGSLRTARTAAVTEYTSVAVWINTKEHQYGMEGSDELFSLPEGVNVTITTVAEESSGNQAAIRFYADGSSSGGTIELRHAQQLAELKVDWLTGRVKLLSNLDDE